MITKLNLKDRTIKSYAIRKLTPLECFRLMGVRDEVIALMQSTVKEASERTKTIYRGKPDDMAISASQQYKQAGNSIVVDVLAQIYAQLWYPEQPEQKKQMSLLDAFFPEDVLPRCPWTATRARR